MRGKINPSFFVMILALCFSFNELTAQTEKDQKQERRKKQLVLSITDTGTGNRLEAIKPIATYLSKELNMIVVADTAKRVMDVMEEVKDGKVDLGFINSFGYVLAVTENFPISLLVMPGNEKDKPSVYNSCIISAKGKNIQSLEGLLENAHEYDFLFVNPTSASGHLVPRLYFKKLGIPQAEAAFKELSFGDNHYKTIDKIVKGEADAGAVAYNILQTQINAGVIKKEDINVLWVSDEIPQTPMVVNANMDEQLRVKVMKALLSIHTKDPELWKHIQKNFSARDAAHYIPAKDSHYDAIRKISGGIEDLLFILNFYLD